MHRSMFVVVLLIGMIAFGFGWLMSNVRQGIFPEPVVMEPEAAPQHRTEVPAPAVAMPETQQRVPVFLADDGMVTDLRAENARLRARIKELERSIKPTDSAQVAALVGVKQEDVTNLLERSELIPNNNVLTQVASAAGAEAAWSALKEEAALYLAVADFKAKNPVPPGQEHQWHHYTFVPFYSTRVEQVVQRLYQLGLPSTVVEPFRTRLNEGI